MSFFSWFSGKSRLTRGDATGQAAQVATVSDKLPPTRHHCLEPESRKPEGELKNKRHGRREQLYEAIREAMTNAGVLSASYKFKVLSFNQESNDFLIMIDLTVVAGDTVSTTAEMEALIVQSAKVRHDIMVSAVYWRVNEVTGASRMTSFSAAMVAVPVQSSRRVPAFHEPIQADEVAAFQQALLAASAHGASVVLEKSFKATSRLKFVAQTGDFEDTHVSASHPGLSNTQYGELRQMPLR